MLPRPARTSVTPALLVALFALGCTPLVDVEAPACTAGRCADPCAVSNAGCDVNATCNGAPGASASCSCNAGFVGDGFVCLDPDSDSCLDDRVACVGGQPMCVAGTDTSVELCDDQLDNDCDGAIDCADPECGAASCDDRDSCTASSTCQGGSCVGSSYRSCPAADACHDAGICAPTSGGCSTGAVSAGWCSIEGACYAVGAPDPANSCRICSASSQSGFTSRDGPHCGGGMTCSAGACVDVNECASDNGGCGAYESCANNVGAPPTCRDVDECLVNNGGCSRYLTCVNNVAAPPTCADVNELSEPIKLAEARNAFTFAYAPTIIHTQGAYHAYFCSGGVSDTSWDWVRHVSSTDLITWTSPDVVATPVLYERSNCDPSIVRHDLGDGLFYYLFYSGNVSTMQTVNFVARSTSPAGPFLKLTQRGTWEAAPTDPKVVTVPAKPQVDHSYWCPVTAESGVVVQTGGEPGPPGCPGIYGAGQPSVVVRDNKLYMWFTDTTARLPEVYEGRIYLTTTTDLVTWTPPVRTTIDKPSIDVKYDGASGNFVVIEQDAPHQRPVAMYMRASRDGVTWTEPSLIGSAAHSPDWSHNIGMSGDERGHIETQARMMVAYGAPLDLSPLYDNDCSQVPNFSYCAPHWSLYGNIIKLGLSGSEQPHTMTSAQSNDVLNGWPAAAVIDGNVASVYSSNQFASAVNDRGVHLVAYADTLRSVSKVILTARMSGAQSEAFPLAYAVYLTDAENTAWVPVGTFTTQPGADGVATVKLAASYQTFGVLVSPTTLGTDSNGAYFFQMAEVQLAGW